MIIQLDKNIFSDGQQTLSFPEAERLYKRLRQAFELREAF